ncbi:Biotin/lipoate A/B protein ligase [Pleurotus pulmonarius]|nr:Biotin/lipoate A/B protein ligase [Pleurotus pulmonarius]
MFLSSTTAWRHLCTHSFQTSASRRLPISPNHSIYVSNATNPYFNLTLEDWLFRHKDPEEPLLLVYRDDPCVVIGRNQNPWKEVNAVAARKRNIPIVRRRSGGGTVYHDLGNTNFSIHLPRKSFDRHETSQIPLRAVRSLGIDAILNERNDICIVNNRAYHHGTMLISTRLDTLGDLLRVNKNSMVTRGVASVRSPVCNLQQFNTNARHETFAEAVVDEFRDEYSVHDEVCYVEETEDIKGIDYIAKGMAELPSWEWLYGQTPEFTYMVQESFSWGTVKVDLRSSHGIVRSSLLHVSDTTLPGTIVERLADLARGMEGRRYGDTDSTWNNEQGPTADVARWLTAVMHS